MEKVKIELATEPLCKGTYNTYFRVISNRAIPALLWSAILSCLEDWMKFEQGKKPNRFEVYRCVKQKGKGSGSEKDD